ncbi:MAG: hypothetical protein QM820_61635 [Minicystis sp.]
MSPRAVALRAPASYSAKSRIDAFPMRSTVRPKLTEPCMMTSLLEYGLNPAPGNTIPRRPAPIEISGRDEVSAGGATSGAAAAACGPSVAGARAAG